jgi:hypothetical protein
VALVVGMLLDQQVPMETAFAGARVSHVSGPQKVSHKPSKKPASSG